MKIGPTRLVGVHQRQGKTYLTIEVRLPNGHRPISWFRGMNVGVGGRFTGCKIAPGEPIRRATLSELRILDRLHIAEFRRDYPDAEIVVSRSWH